MTRREREIDAGRKHAVAAAKWAAVATSAAAIGRTPEATSMGAMLAGMAKDTARDAVTSMVEHSAQASALILGPSPKRIRSRAARRVRMARKRRRGWA